MSRRVGFLPLLPVFLLAACGSSSHPTASTGATGTAPPPPSTQSAPAATGAPKQPTTAPAAGSGGAATSGAPAGGAEPVRLPASFVIRPGGALSPASVSSPAFLAIQLTIASGDGRPHRALLRTPTQRSLSVPAGGRASGLIPGLRAGRYAILIDGVPRGALVIGGEPGP